MTLRAEYAALPSKFDAFLFASIGEEESGTPLSVMSALVRAGIDPWKESERLSMMRRDAAGDALSSHIARLHGCWSSADVPSIAARLLELLPAPGSAASETTRTNSAAAEPVVSKSTVVLIVLAAATCLVWWLGG